MTDQSWRKVFVGREEELKLLHDAWGKAKDGKPQFVTFLAETGVGKTRLVQHFYAELTKEEDPDHYWPDSMDSAAASLAINPEFPNSKAQGKIPWLWWGLRARDPAGRNQAENFGCAVQDAECKIEPHAISILFNRQKKTLTKDMYIELIKLGCDSFADWVTLGVVSKLYDASQLVLKYKEERKRQKQEQLTIHQITEQKKADISEKAFDYLSTVLDKKDKDAPTVPVILVLDDAQWFDRTSLNFVEMLWRAASKNGWALLIVATHWRVEWEQDSKQADITPADQPPCNLVDLMRRNSTLFDAWKPHKLRTMPGNILQPMLNKALPGLTAEQQHIILERVGGNPDFLSDLIQWILDDAGDFFADGDCNLPLTDDGEEDVMGQLHKDHMDLVRKRFGRLDEKMRNLLGFGSYQGVRFIEPLMLDIMQKLKGESDWQKYYTEAVHPHVVISRINHVSDEFRQRNMFEAAHEHLHVKKRKADEFRAALLIVLCDWYESGKIAQQPASEREALLILLCREIDGLPEHADLLVHVQMALVELYIDNYKSFDAAGIALTMVKKMPKDGWHLEILSFREQDRLGMALINFSHQEEAKQLYSSLIQHLQSIEIQDKIWQNDLAVAYMNRGNIHYQQSHIPEALADYQAAIETLQQLRYEMNEQSPQEWQNNLATAYMNRGNLHFLLQDHAPAAMTDYQAAIEIRQQLRNKMGEQFPLEWQNDLASSHMNRGNLYLRQNYSMEALIDYRAGINIRQQLCDAMRNISPPAWKNNLAQDYVCLGILFADKLSIPLDGLASYRAAINILQRLRDEVNEQFQPEWEHNLAHTYMNRGNLHQWLNHTNEAAEDYQTAITILQQLQDAMGVQFAPEWKNNSAQCYYNFASLYELFDKEKACSLFSHALQLATSLHDEFGDGMPESWMQVLTASEEACKRCGV